MANAAPKRHGYLVEPERVISWDHPKLAQPPGTSSVPACRRPDWRHRRRNDSSSEVCRAPGR